MVKYSPELATPLHGCLGDLRAAGLVKRITMERDALLTIKTKENWRDQSEAAGDRGSVDRHHVRRWISG